MNFEEGRYVTTGDSESAAVIVIGTGTLTGIQGGSGSWRPTGVQLFMMAKVVRLFCF